jgi:hypothetical protein
VDLDLALSHLGAPRVDVDSDDPCSRAQVVLPHLQRAALPDAELDQRHLPAAKRREMPVVDVEVVNPFVDQPAGVSPEVNLEWVARRGWLSSKQHRASRRIPIAEVAVSQSCFCNEWRSSDPEAMKPCGRSEARSTPCPSL